MSVMPHTDIEKALELALGLDIPFWPQLPNVSFYEDMYAQTSESFPGVVIDPDDKGEDWLKKHGLSSLGLLVSVGEFINPEA